MRDPPEPGGLPAEEHDRLRRDAGPRGVPLFEAMDFPTVAAFGASPAWLGEGAAEWVGETLEPSSDGFWGDYLTLPAVPLFSRAYSAIGFFALITSSGENTWHSPRSHAQGPEAAPRPTCSRQNRQLKEDWPSSLARQPAFGAGWDASGPGNPRRPVRPPHVGPAQRHRALRQCPMPLYQRPDKVSRRPPTSSRSRPRRPTAGCTRRTGRTSTASWAAPNTAPTSAGSAPRWRRCLRSTGVPRGGPETR